MKAKFFTHLFVLGLFVSATEACSWIITMDDVYEKQGFLVTPKNGKRDCDLKFVTSLHSDSTNYELIGTCISEKPTYKKKNMAIRDIFNCACHYGGDFAKIIRAEEYAEKHTLFINGIPLARFRNPSAPKNIAKDLVIAEIYRKLN